MDSDFSIPASSPGMSQQVNPVAVIPTGAVAKIIFNVTGSPEDRLTFQRYRFAPIPMGHHNSDKYMVFSECKWCVCERECDVSFSSVMVCDLTFFSIIYSVIYFDIIIYIFGFDCFLDSDHTWIRSKICRSFH